MRTYIFQRTQLLLIIMLVVSCGKEHENFWKEFTEKEKKLLDELSNLYSGKKEYFEKFREKIVNQDLKFREKAMLYEKEQIFISLNLEIRHLKVRIDHDQRHLRADYDWFTKEQREEIKGKINYNRKLLELYKLRREYYGRDLYAARKKRI